MLHKTGISQIFNLQKLAQTTLKISVSAPAEKKPLHIKISFQYSYILQKIDAIPNKEIHKVKTLCKLIIGAAPLFKDNPRTYTKTKITVL